jgi:CheY-like chemotaxis protein
MNTSRARILVVEDEVMISMMIEDMLDDLGYAIAGLAARVADAMRLAEQDGISAALLDVNLAGERVYPVADKLLARGIPIVFLTGYGASGIDTKYARYPVLAKPFDRERLRAVLHAALPTA